MQHVGHRVALVTGATKNIGYATAKRFAKEGYDVCITSRDGSRAKTAAEAIMKEYPGITVKGYEMVPAEVEQIRKVFAQVKEQFGRLDVMVANATAPGFRNILTTTPEDFDFMMNSNARAYFFCSQEAAKIMIEQGGGCIILIGSVNGIRPLPNKILYAASKSAISSFNRSIAIELGKYNIRCNCVVPGAVWNDRWIGMSDEAIAARRDNWPLGRESQPEDIANAVYFLASDQAATITGIEFVVDSGVTANLLKYDKNWDQK